MFAHGLHHYSCVVQHTWLASHGFRPPDFEFALRVVLPVCFLEWFVLYGFTRMICCISWGQMQTNHTMILCGCWWGLARKIYRRTKFCYKLSGCELRFAVAHAAAIRQREGLHLLHESSWVFVPWRGCQAYPAQSKGRIAGVAAAMGCWDEAKCFFRQGMQASTVKICQGPRLWSSNNVETNARCHPHFTVEIPTCFFVQIRFDRVHDVEGSPHTKKKSKLFVSNKFDPAKQKLHKNNISGTELMRRMITKGLDVKTAFVAKGMGCQCFLQRVN